MCVYVLNARVCKFVCARWPVRHNTKIHTERERAKSELRARELERVRCERLQIQIQ